MLDVIELHRGAGYPVVLVVPERKPGLIPNIPSEERSVETFHECKIVRLIPRSRRWCNRIVIWVYMNVSLIYWTN